MLAGDIHSNPGPNSGRTKFCRVDNTLYIIATARDFFEKSCNLSSLDSNYVNLGEVLR